MQRWMLPVAAAVVVLTGMACGQSNEQVLETRSLPAQNCQTVTEDQLAGDDRGGIAVSRDKVFYTGDATTVGFVLTSLKPVPTSPPVQRDGMVSNTVTQEIWQVGRNDGTLLTANNAFFPEWDRLFLLDDQLQLTGTELVLSESLQFQQNAVGVFSGPDIAIFGSDGGSHTQFKVVSLVTGTVTTVVGPGIHLAIPCETWAYFGWAEKTHGELFVVYVGFPGSLTSPAVIRRNITTGAETTLLQFAAYGDICSIIPAPEQSRWYWHYEIRPGDTFPDNGPGEQVGYCDGHFSFGASL